MVKAGAVALVLAALAALGGCGGEDGADDGATVRVYVSAPLCDNAKVELARRDGRAGDLEVRAVCLADVEGVEGVDLATVGTNARRTTEDSSSVAFIADPEVRARRGSRPIVEAAGIAQIGGYPGWAAMKFVLDAIEEGDQSHPRREVFENAGGR